jgi:hypothetical protein
MIRRLALVALLGAGLGQCTALADDPALRGQGVLAPRLPPPEVVPPVQPVVADRLRPLDAVELAPQARREILPPDYAAARFGREPEVFQPTGSSRLWGESVYSWEATGLCHRPLYFEDENLERYGRSHGHLQPLCSIAHFSGRFAAWPYLMGAYPPHECIYTLGKTPPGTYVPYHIYRPPLSARGVVYEAGAVTGLIFLVP